MTGGNASHNTATTLGNLDGAIVPMYPRYMIDGFGDELDYYSFALSEPRRVRLGLLQLDADADLFLEDESGNVVDCSEEAGTSDEWIDTLLDPGLFFIRVEAREIRKNEYILRFGVLDSDS